MDHFVLAPSQWETTLQCVCVQPMRDDVALYLIGWAHTQNDPCKGVSMIISANVVTRTCILRNIYRYKPQASHQPSEWFAQMCRCVLTNRHKAVLFAWLNSMVPLEEPQNHCLLVNTQRHICAKRIHHSLGWCEACDINHENIDRILWLV